VSAPPASALDTLQSRSFDGQAAGPVSTVDAGTIPWSQVRGAFMAGNTLFYGDADGKFLPHHVQRIVGRHTVVGRSV